MYLKNFKLEQMQVSIDIVIKVKSLPSVNNDYIGFKIYFGFSAKCLY